MERIHSSNTESTNDEKMIDRRYHAAPVQKQTFPVNHYYLSSKIVKIERFKDSLCEQARSVKVAKSTSLTWTNFLARWLFEKVQQLLEQPALSIEVT